MRTEEPGGCALSCSAEVSCKRPVKSNGIELTAYAPIGVRCQQAAADEPWWCWCASPQDAMKFELGSAPDAQAACAGAAARCQEELGLEFGFYERFVAPDPPLP